ncbi:methyltransferase domain-containing protein [Actinomadura sp. 7K507]|uniref:methyltransferase domain-containing protein n=1 Tax=Actinomadura sp. 7K507 TaxID=2530365 RepID=UPI001052DDEC|nr:methyltransferase domain-containing protein [Actinomadura sp. 7K507]TDC86442.1 hypothetical protein E1285_23355 [Actinomadura sp. 7K507]
MANVPVPRDLDSFRGDDLTDRFTTPGSWEFTAEVADDFDNHVRLSVPFYDDVQQLIERLSDWLAPEKATIADLGASTGTTARLISQRHPERALNFHLYDSQESMLEIAHEKLRDTSATSHYHASRIEHGLCHYDAKLTLALFTLQFLEPGDRLKVLRDARERSQPHGALIVAEKLRLVDPRWQEIAICSSHDYKAEKGIGARAIYVKERSLRGVLNPLTDRQQREMLHESGWTSIETLFRWQQWVMYAAFASNCT